MYSTNVLLLDLIDKLELDSAWNFWPRIFLIVNFSKGQVLLPAELMSSNSTRALASHSSSCGEDKNYS
jgi:hypothetical protein